MYLPAASSLPGQHLYSRTSTQVSGEQLSMAGAMPGHDDPGCCTLQAVHTFFFIILVITHNSTSKQSVRTYSVAKVVIISHVPLLVKCNLHYSSLMLTAVLFVL